MVTLVKIWWLVSAMTSLRRC